MKSTSFVASAPPSSRAGPTFQKSREKSFSRAQQWFSTTKRPITSNSRSQHSFRHTPLHFAPHETSAFIEGPCTSPRVVTPAFCPYAQACLHPLRARGRLQCRQIIGQARRRPTYRFAIVPDRRLPKARQAVDQCSMRGDVRSAAGDEARAADVVSDLSLLNIAIV